MISIQDTQVAQAHPDLWFEDGNVVLIAELTAFRVHKSVLGRTSDFFRDMFSLPQPEIEQAEGEEQDLTPQCPTIPTSETAEDLAYFLDVIYNSLKYLQKDSQITYPALRAILVLSHKFSSEELRSFAIGRLEAAFPRRFADWEAIATGECPQPVVYNGAELISIANLARELELREVLPVVLYHCCQQDIDWILEGADNESEVEAPERGDEGDEDADRSAGRQHDVQLDRENQKSCLIARSKLTAATLSMLATFAYVRDGMCDQFTCTTALREISFGKMIKDSALHDPLLVLDEEFRSAPQPQQQGMGVLNMVGGPPPTGIAGLCRHCRDSCRNQMRIAREQLLQNIEEYIPIDI